MDIVKDAGIVVDWCKTCNGLWFDMGELNRYITDKKSPESFIKDCNCTKGTLACPVCWEPMDEVRAGHFVIDRCTQCRGLWFDAGEVGMLKGLMSTSHGQAREGLCEGMVGYMLVGTNNGPGGSISGVAVETGADLSVESIYEGATMGIDTESVTSGLAEGAESISGGLAEGAESISGGLAEGAVSVAGDLAEGAVSVAGDLAEGAVSVAGGTAEVLANLLGGIFELAP